MRRGTGWFAGVWPPILSAAVGPTSPPETSVIDRATSAVGPGAATEAVRHHAAARHGVVCWRLAADPERCSGPYLATRNVSDRSSNIRCRARRRYGGGAAPRCVFVVMPMVFIHCNIAILSKKKTQNVMIAVNGASKQPSAPPLYKQLYIDM